MATDGVAADVDEGWRSSARSHPYSVPTAAPPHKQLQMYSPSPLIDPDRSGYVSSAGGKLRTIRNSGRRNANPYERPAVGRHASAGPQAAVLISNGGVTAAQALAEKRRGAWLAGGLTKIITNSANYLYTSIFRRRLPAPVQVSNNEEEPAIGEEQVSSPSAETNAAEPVSRSEGDEEHAEQEPSNNTVTEIERLLQKKTLSGEEYERLSALLRSRVVNNTTERKKQVSQLERASHQQNHLPVATQTEAQRWRQELQKSREERENGVRTLALYENGTPSSATATPAVGAESMDGLNSSPVDVAIAFMGRRVVRAQGSTSPAEPLNRRDENLVSSGPASLVMSQATLSKWTPPDFNDEEQFRTPAPPLTQTRSRAQSLLRTPYSRPQRLQPSRERALDGTFGTPLSARWTPIRTPIVGGREMLKRRSTVLDDSYASVGPIRRTRHKALNSPAPATSARASAFPLQTASGSSVMTLSSSQRFAGTATNQKNAGPVTGQEKGSLAVSGMSYVPVQSSETARKILETLEKMTPSPTGKSLEEELSYVRSKPPATLTENMLNEHARRSMTVVDFTLPTGDSREPGPSGRTLHYDSPGLSQFDAGTKSSEPVMKTKGKGKSTASLPENGPSGLQSIQERKKSDAGLLDEVSLRTKDSDAVLASSSEKGRGFRMTAVFEESGSDDEGRQNATAGVSSPTGVPTSSLTATSTKPATTSGKSVFAVTAQVTTSGLFSRPTTDSVVTAQSSGASPAVNVSQISPPAQAQVTSSFTFPTRVSLEGPPTPKAMSPASTSPKGAPAITPFFSFAANVPGASALAASSANVELTSTTVQSDTLTETKSDFTFGSTSIPSLSSQTVSKVQATTEVKAPSLFNERSSLVGSSASSGLLTTLGTPTSTGVAPSTSAPPTSVPSGLKFGEPLSSAPISTPSVKEGSKPSISSSPFGAATGGVLFGAGGGITSSSTAAGLSSSLFGSSSGQGSSVSFAATNVGFSQSTSVSAAPSSAPAVSLASEAQAVPARSTAGTASSDDRPQKRSAFSFDQESNKPQPSATTSLSQPFTTFGTSVLGSAGTAATPVTFGAAFSTAPSSQNLFAASTFGQPPRDLQSSGASTPATSVAPVSAPAPASTVSPSPFLFGAPPSTASNSTQVSAAADTSTPSFPAFTSSVFGSSSGGSIFGVTPAAPVSFGSTPSAPAFGSTPSKPAFGGFATEAVSQSPSLPVFGSGFGAAPAQSPASAPAPAPAPAPVFSFGGSSAPAPAPAFSFATGASSSSSGASFGFGSTSSFAFGSTKTSPAAPAPAPTPSIFGLPSSVPAFGSTTNGTMTSDVVVSDHSNMEDSMAEEPPQVAAGIPAQQASPFGGQSSATTSSFVFGAQAGAPAAAPPLFGFQGQPSPGAFGANPFAAANAAQLPSPAGPLNFSGGAFNLGASGGDSGRTRKFIKAKRTGTKRGK
ncbi:hypothetical protein R1sor_002069 [Riccia sorocarpa]|uniref:Nuclear pore complex protein n=1 Tax=Riccia sorocarpa TaxID=122646 RepID=A0ABD3GXQ6_9MARC